MTAQASERFLEGGEAYPLLMEPLRPLLEQRSLDIRSFCQLSATHCYRGYVASWLVQEGKLFLHEIEVIALLGRAPVPDELKSMLFEITASQAFPIFASWFNGNLRIGLGKRYDYRHAFGIYPEERVIEIKDGVAIWESRRRNANPSTDG